MQRIIASFIKVFLNKYLIQKHLSTFRASINRPSKSDPAERRSPITVARLIAAVAIIIGDLHLSALSAKVKVVAVGGELYNYGICAEHLKTSEAAAVLMRHWVRVRNDR